MSKKAARIAKLIENCAGQRYDPHYIAYFHCFNQQLFFEAHEVLEKLWLKERGGPNGGFYKALIQLAGGFVHLEKNRLRPAAALFKLARKYLGTYPSIHEGLDLREVMTLIDTLLRKLGDSDFSQNFFEEEPPPWLQFAS